MIIIVWTDASKGYNDVLDEYSFIDEGVFPSCEHKCLARDGNCIPAQFSLHVSAHSAVLDYAGVHTQFNESHGIAIGQLKLSFRDNDRRNVDKIYWRDGKNDFKIAPAYVETDLSIEDIEGGLNIVAHLKRERSPLLRAAKIKEAIKNGQKIRCEACGFDFEKKYGSMGKGYCEVHHRSPLAANGKRVTRLDDLAILCPNCHRMIHKTEPLMTVESFSTEFWK